MTHPLRLLSILCAVLPGVAFAQDVVVTPGPNSGFVVKDDTGTIERLRVDEETGNISREGQLFLHGTGIGGNLFLGRQAGNSSMSGVGNVSVGAGSLQLNTFGDDNTSVGTAALFSNTSGSGNTAIGRAALGNNTSASHNTAVGWLALGANSSGHSNAAVGYESMAFSSSGDANTALGYKSLRGNVSGGRNVALGSLALISNASGFDNIAIGSDSLDANITGSRNVGIGWRALGANNSGEDNIAIGKDALTSNVTQSDNIAIGDSALFNLTSGTDNIAIGHFAANAMSTGSNNIVIGSQLGIGDHTNSIWIGNSSHVETYIKGIYGAVTTDDAVYINASGKLGTFPSSARFKQDVLDMGEKSELLMKLRPVSFRYREGVAGDAQLVHYGLIAEEVAQIDPALVSYEADGSVHSVRYQFLAPMLVNEAQQQRRVIAEQRARIDELTARLERLEALLASARVASR